MIRFSREGIHTGKGVPDAGVYVLGSTAAGGEAGVNWLIRECRPTEAAEVLNVWRHAGAIPGVSDTEEDILRMVKEGPAFVLVAETNGHLIGTVVGVFDGWRGNVYRLAVLPEHRRRGVARSLVTEVEKRLARQGAKKVTALVEKDHPWATGFWSAAGYEHDDRMVRYVRDS